jgi:apolipoprotein N-acyltransferase
VGLGPRNDDGTYSLFNSASFFREDGTYGGRYDKMHLVPFGEYVPYKPLFFFTGHLLDGLPFIPGQQRVLFDDHGRKYGVFICYESIFGDEIRQFVSKGAQVLVNLSDDGWYGDTSAPWEHLDMVRMRAIENDRWVLRSTNTGVTASIDPYGRIVDQMPRHVRGALLANFNYISDLTFYTRYGDWIAWICAFLTALLVITGLTRSRSQRPAQ